MAVRDEIVLRSGIVYFVVVVMALVLFVRIIFLQFVQRAKWTAMSEKYVFKTDEEPANRGDILACDGRLLASSIPYFSIYMDTRSTGMSSQTFSQGIDGLSEGLSRLLGVRSPAGWKAVITEAREKVTGTSLLRRKSTMPLLKR
jgi:cell division protein FtsI (penicillin-binding protein 3)